MGIMVSEVYEALIDSGASEAKGCRRSHSGQRAVSN